MNANSSSCQVDDTELLAYRDGELAPAQHNALATHLEQCPVCQARLADAARLTETLRLGSPERNQPVARAALHQRIAGERGTWWRQRVVIGTVLPAVALLVIVIGVNRWLDDDRCDSCPPLPMPMQITATSGLPAGWGALLSCQRLPPNRSLVQAQPSLPDSRLLAAAPEIGPDPGRQPRRDPRAITPREQPAQAALGQTDRRLAANGPGCAPGSLARNQQPDLSNGSTLGATSNWSGPPGS